MKSKRPIPRHIIIKLSKDKKQKNFESSKKEVGHHIQGILNRIISSLETLKARRQWADILKVLKENNLTAKITITSKTVLQK